ncbi:MAG TPA: uracil-DNA glycosylase family protein, partial [Terriglobales bacterium]
MPSALMVLNKEIVGCTKCPRLVEYRERVGREKRKAYREHDYWARPVPGFGDSHARVLLLGLAPGAHGANRTGRPFTGDASGNFMYPILYKVGFTSQPIAVSCNDGLKLIDCY